jgi:hypothetical protein
VVAFTTLLSAPGLEYGLGDESVKEIVSAETGRTKAEHESAKAMLIALSLYRMRAKVTKQPLALLNMR